MNKGSKSSRIFESFRDVLRLRFAARNDSIVLIVPQSDVRSTRS